MLQRPSPLVSAMEGAAQPKLAIDTSRTDCHINDINVYLPFVHRAIINPTVSTQKAEFNNLTSDMAKLRYVGCFKDFVGWFKAKM